MNANQYYKEQEEYFMAKVTGNKKDSQHRQKLREKREEKVKQAKTEPVKSAFKKSK